MKYSITEILIMPEKKLSRKLHYENYYKFISIVILSEKDNHSE